MTSRNALTDAQKAMKAKIEAVISERGGYSQEDLAKLGIPWPPQKGWKAALIRSAK